MAQVNISHRRTHNLLLISKLLSSRDHASPLSLVLDTLEQVAIPLIREYIRRANLSKSYVIYLGFETASQPHGVDYFISCYNKSPQQIAQAVSRSLSTSAAKRNLLIIDSLHSLSVKSLDPKSGLNLTAYLSAFIGPGQDSSQQTSIVAVYHTDINLPAPPAHLSYQPPPLSLLMYLATTILRVHSVSILLSTKIAEERSQAAPIFGLSEEKDGIIVGLKPTKFKESVLKPEEKGVVLELEHRRKSGRGVREWYFLPSTSPNAMTPQNFRETIVLLDDHPLFRKSKEHDPKLVDQDLDGLTFQLSLTDRQKLERDGVVLPYFDAQKGGGQAGPGEGGRILYDMGSEDDFDEEEDEI